MPGALSPLISWTRNSASTPECGHGLMRPRSTISRIRRQGFHAGIANKGAMHGNTSSPVCWAGSAQRCGGCCGAMRVDADTPGSPKFWNDDERVTGVVGLVGESRLHPGGDGSDGGVLETGMASARG